jgi:predicted acetyltransferase
MADSIQLVEPRETWRDEFIAYCKEFRDAGEPVVHGQLADAEADFPGLIQKWARGAAGENLEEGQAPYSVYWLIRDNRILGTARFRHRLTEATAKEGGHIGYEVRPSERRKGYASELLRLVLEQARGKGLSRSLLTCQKDNASSLKVIEKNGGVLEGEVLSARTGKPVLRYWINL